MLAHFERRLATVLGNALPAPFAGRVRVAPQTAPGPGPSVLVGVRQAVPLPLDFGSVRPEAVPAPPERQRVVRLRCTLGILIVPQPVGDRGQVVSGVDALVYVLDGPDFRTAAVLVAAGDQGFALTSLCVQEVWPDLRPDDGAPPHLTLQAEGCFWPVGTVAEAGVEIVETRVRQVNLPLSSAALPTRIAVGGDPVELRIATDLAGTMRLRRDDATTAAFGSLAIRLLGEVGGPGAGSLAGGAVGPEGSRLVEVTDDVATVTYTPPDAPTTDRVLVHLPAGTGASATLGLELARFTLAVKAGA